MSVSLWHRIECALTLESIRAIFDPNSPAYWQKYDPWLPLIFSSYAMNAVFWIVAVLTGFVAIFRKLATSKEIVWSFFLLGIPYISVGYTQCMMSHRRFVLMVFPFFIAVGILLSHLPRYVSLSILCISAVWLGLMSAMLASGGYHIL